MWLTTRRQRHNVYRALLAVHERAVNQGWSAWRAQNMAVMVINVMMSESGLHDYGNAYNPESQQLADRVPVSLQWRYGKRWIGSDHDSVGLFQQRTSWGSTRRRMDPKPAAHAFMGRAGYLGVDNVDHREVWHDIQTVQVSYDPSGHNYEVNTEAARKMVAAYWDREARNLKGKHRRKIARNWHFPRSD